jgi:hypothetical protein
MLIFIKFTASILNNLSINNNIYHQKNMFKKSFAYFKAKFKAKPIKFSLMLCLGLFLSRCAYTQVIDRIIDPVDPDKDVVRISMDGQNFNIPLRYMYSETLELAGQWRRPKKERVEVAYLNIDFLLPELKFYEEKDKDKWQELGHGDKLHLSLGKIYGEKWDYKKLYYTQIARIYDDSPLPYQNNNIISKYKDGEFIYTKKNDIYGLYFVEDKNGSQEYYDKKFKIKIDCYEPQNQPSPGCSIWYLYNDQFELSYDFAYKYLPEWQKIQDQVNKKIDYFAELAKNEHIKTVQ